MKSKQIVRLLIFCVLCISFSFSYLFSGLGFLPDGAAEDKVVKLSDRVYMVTIEYSLRPNIGVSAGPDGILLVDTGHKEGAARLKSILKKIGKGNVGYIINTHPHGDHAGGNEACGKNATVIGYRDLDKKVADGPLSIGKGPLKGRSGRGFEKYYAMRFNGEEIRIIPSPGAHSRYDLIIYFIDSGVVHMGDLLLTQSFPAVGPRVRDYLEILDTVIDVFPEDTKFIGGHGRDYSLEDVRKYKKMLQTTIEIVRKEMNAGKSVQEMKDAKILKKWESWGEFLTFLNTDTWIESIYESYK